MAVPHFSVSIVSRGCGRSAVLSAAYRHRARMEYEREARTVDYSRRQDLLHEAFAIPGDAPDWLRDMTADRSVTDISQAFWNRVETVEQRCDAQLARDVTIALPLELSPQQNIAMVSAFVEQHLTAKGMVADWVLHDAPGNPHVHLMTTLRPLTADGFGPKRVAMMAPDSTPLRNDAGKIVYQPWAGGIDWFNAFRDGWFACQNRHLALAGLDIHIDGRSFEKQGIGLVPTMHIGVGAKAIDRKVKVARSTAVASPPLTSPSGDRDQPDLRSSQTSPTLERLALQQLRRDENARRIVRNPDLVPDLITREKSVFDERDVARVLHRCVDDPHLFQSLMIRILQSPQVLCLQRERIDLATGLRAPARYTTRTMIRLEAEMASRAGWLADKGRHGIEDTLRESVLGRHTRLSDEQRTAIAHVTAEGHITAVIGRAGAGKTTMMKAAREVWQAAGYRVIGAALAGKAAEGLEKEAGIPSKTLSSWQLRWSHGRDGLDGKTVFVLDEAGMVASRQMAHVVETVTKAGAKLVLIGDPEQLQPIEAGAAFRMIAARIGYAELDTIYRQHQQWMRDASLDLAKGKIDRALQAYDAHGRLHGSTLKAGAINTLIDDWNRSYDPQKSSLILAHLRRDVHLLNRMARARLVGRGLLQYGSVFSTEEGERHFAAGDRIVFLKNDASLGVKNGMLAKVVEAIPGRIVAEVGEGASAGKNAGDADGSSRRHVTVDSRFYNSLDHGYATTIHKAQGATVDRVMVLASLSLDRHLTYVAMTRHREDLAVYYGQKSFGKAGGLTKILSRCNAKETTLDYASGSFYRQALLYAETRGLHLMAVARTMLRDRLDRIVRQKHRLVDLATRLQAIGKKLGITNAPAEQAKPDPLLQTSPMVAGTTTFANTVAQAVEDRLAADPKLTQQWQQVSMRFHLVYADPQSAFRAINVDAMLVDEQAAKMTMAKFVAEPERFGALRGRTGLLASRSDRQDRQTALVNVPALVRNLGDYLVSRETAQRQHEAEEQALRQKMAIDIPRLSPQATDVLRRVHDAIERDDLQTIPALTTTGATGIGTDRSIRAELERFEQAVAERFGERNFLPLAAKDTDGKVFKTLTAGMNPAQKAGMQAAWQAMRSIQKLAARQRTAAALQEAEVLRQTQRQGKGQTKTPGLSLK